MLIIVMVFSRTHYYKVMSVAHVCLASLGDRQGFQIILQPPYLCSLHTCSPKAQPPKGIIQESLVLQPSQLFTKNQDLFWLCNDSDHLK